MQNVESKGLLHILFCSDQHVLYILIQLCNIIWLNSLNVMFYLAIFFKPGKLIGMGSDGAANMVGKTSGLATLLKEEIGGEFVNIHCMCHRLELAVRDVFKTSKLYEKLMTLMIGLHYFYCKNNYKNKSGLLRTMSALQMNGLLPPKVTGTRWLAHTYHGINSLLRTYLAYDAHLSTLSYSNPKAEGLLKIMLDKNLIAFILFFQVSTCIKQEISAVPTLNILH